MNYEPGRLLGVAYRMLGSCGDAEDSASEALGSGAASRRRHPTYNGRSNRSTDGLAW